MSRSSPHSQVGSEYSATFVGRLVTTMIQKAGDRLGDNLEALLKAVLSKLSGSVTLSVIQVRIFHRPRLPPFSSQI